MPYKNPIWIKCECDKGKRFTAIKGGSCEVQDLEACFFSGCKNDHGIKVIGETSNRTEAHGWFRM